MDKVKRIREGFEKEKLDGVLISSVSNISYLTSYTNFSKEDRDAFLLITKKGQYIITHDLYAEEIETKVKDFKLIKVTPEKRTRQILIEVLGDKKKLGIEEYDLSLGEYRRLLKGFKLKNFEVDRSIKNSDELVKIKKACQIAEEAFKGLLEEVREGISEIELSRRMDKLIRELRGEVAFPMIMAFGKNSSVPHHRADETRLKKGDIIQMDFGASFENYCCDISRVVFFSRAPEEQKRIYQVVLKAQESAFRLGGGGMKVAEMDQVAREYIRRQGYPDIPHALGHGVGIEVHERPHLSPRSKEVLEEGMVFTLEPGVYLPGVGGVRIEDVYVYQDGKIIQLTKSPKGILEI